MRALATAVAVLATGCYGVAELEGTWEPIEALAAPLAADTGPTPGGPTVPLVSPDTLRIGSFNVHFADDPAQLVRELRASPTMARADVLLLQEIEAYPAEPASRARQLADGLGMTWLYVPSRVEGSGTHGLAILSRLPLRDARFMRLPHADSAWNERDRIALAVEVEVAGVAVTIVNVHLDVRIGAVDRIRELHPAVIDLPATVAVGGDFNTNPWAWVGSAVPLTGTQAIVGQDQASVLDDYLGALGFAIPIPPDETTFNLPLIGGRLDNVYPRGLTVRGAGVATEVDGSDHWPVWVDLAVPSVL